MSEELRLHAPPNDQKPKAVIELLSAGRPTLVMFFADWDTTSGRVKTNVDALRGMYAAKVQFAFIEADNESNAALIRYFDVGGLPDLFVLNKKGEVVQRFEGYVDRLTIEQAIRSELLKGAERPSKLEEIPTPGSQAAPDLP